MATLDMIRRISVQAETKGFKEATADADRLSKGILEIGRTSQASTAGILSQQANLEKLQRTYDASYRNERRMAAAQRELDLARAQGLVTYTRHAQLTDLIRAKHTTAAVANDNLANSYGRVSVALGNMAPLLSRMGMGGAVGMVGGGAFAGIAAGAAAVVGAGAAIAQAGDRWTEYANRLKVAGEASQTLALRQRELTDIAMRSRADLGSTVELYAGLRKATEEMGTSQAQVARVTETITKSFTMGGQSAGAAAGAILQLNQAFASGVLRGDEFNSVMESAPPIARLIAREFGVGMGELRKFAEEGKLSADRVFQAIANGSAEIDREFGKTTVTMTQGTTAAGTALSELGAEMDRVFGISQRLAAGFMGVANAARGIAGAVATYGDERELTQLQDRLQAVKQYEMNVAGLRGRNDYASRQDLAREMEALETARRELRAAEEKRIQGMMQPPPEIRLNAEGRLTNARTVQDLTKATNDLAEAERKYRMDAMGPAARAAAEANKAHEDRLKLYDRLKAGGAEEARINDLVKRSEDMRRQAIAAANAEAAKKAASAARASGRDDGFDRAVIRVEDQTARMRQEAESYGLGAAQAGRYRIELDLITAAQRAQRVLTPDLRAEIARSADEYAAAAERLEELRRQSESMREMRGLVSDFAGGLMRDLKGGTSAVESLGNALDRLSDRLMDMALNSTLDAIFGTGKGGGGFDLFGTVARAFTGGTAAPSLPYGGPRAEGGPVNPSRFYVVGERGPEIFVPKERGEIIPHHAAKDMAQAMTLPQPTRERHTIDSREIIKTMGLERFERETSNTIREHAPERTIRELIKEHGPERSLREVLTERERERIVHQAAAAPSVPALPYGGARAAGGPVSPSQWYMVGERGPEAFVPSVATNRQDILMDDAGTSAPQELHVHISGASGDPHIRMLVAEGVKEGIAAMNKALPGNVQRIVRSSPGRTF